MEVRAGRVSSPACLPPRMPDTTKVETVAAIRLRYVLMTALCRAAPERQQITSLSLSLTD